jgi:toxin ParE1/3/4
MNYTIILSEEAKHDETESYHYYELQRTGLGDEFLDELDNCYAAFASIPEHFGFLDNRNLLRGMSVNRFPFKIIYEISAGSVFVFSVHHMSRKPFENR